MRQVGHCNEEIAKTDGDVPIGMERASCSASSVCLLLQLLLAPSLFLVFNNVGSSSSTSLPSSGHGLWVQVKNNSLESFHAKYKGIQQSVDPPYPFSQKTNVLEAKVGLSTSRDVCSAKPKFHPSNRKLQPQSFKARSRMAPPVG